MDKSLSDALSLLESRVSSPRAHAAVKTLRNELQGGAPSKPTGPPSPGQRAAQSATGRPFGANAGKLAAMLKGAKK